VPCLLGRSGVMEVVEVPLASEELSALAAAAAAVAARWAAAS